MSEEIEKTEEEIDQEIAERKASQKKRGRPKNENYLPWEEAREFIRGELIPSRGKFFEWWERNKPKAIPRFPYRVYHEWTSWNDFLGTNNKFNEKIGTKWRPLLEASTWAHSLKLKSQPDWLEWCKEEGNLPADIPARPDLVYDDWRSWNHWLGNRPVEALEVKKEVQRTRIYYIIHEQHHPTNVLTFGIEPNGITALKARWEQSKFDVIKMYWYEQEKGELINKIITSLSTPFGETERDRIVPNVWELLWHLSMQMDTVKIIG